jgi:hypothetical protein
LPDASCGIAFTLTVKLFTVVVVLALNICEPPETIDEETVEMGLG